MHHPLAGETKAEAYYKYCLDNSTQGE